LLARQELRRHPEQAAPRALAWGEPVLDSALTFIDGRHLYYRGRDAVELSRRLSVEQVAALLWTGDETAAAELFPPAVAASRQRVGDNAARVRAAGAPSRLRGSVGSPAGSAAAASSRALRRSNVDHNLSPIERLQAALPLLAVADEAAWDLRPEAV